MDLLAWIGGAGAVIAGVRFGLSQWHDIRDEWVRRTGAREHLCTDAPVPSYTRTSTHQTDR